MFRKISYALKNRRGFTLVELMVVVVIIGILAGIAVPVYSNVTARAEQKADEANIRIIQGAIQMWAMEQDGRDPADLTIDANNAEDQDKNPLVPEFIEEWPTAPGTYSVTNGKVESTYGNQE